MIKSTSAIPRRSPVRLVPYYLGHFFIYLGFLLIALVLAWLMVKANQIYTSCQVITDHLAILETVFSAEKAGSPTPNPSRIEEIVRETSTALTDLYGASTPFLPLTAYLGWLPVYGGDIQAMPSLLAAGRDLGQAGWLITESFSPSATPETGALPFLVTGLAQRQTDLAQVEVSLRQHQIFINQLEVERLSPAVAQRVGQLKQYLPYIISGVQLAQILPVWLGSESPQTYLILTQNSDELRPTGGYINTAGHLVIDRGQIAEFVMQDSYAIDRLSDDYPYPPAPLYQYMAADYWVLRDASWSPDFPTTAQTASDLYTLGQGISPNGVIAFDQQGIALLLQTFGPLSVESEQVTGDNMIDLMRRHWAPEFGQDYAQWSQQRKSFMLLLAEAIRQKFEQEAATINLSALALGLGQALAEKHLLIYVPSGADFLIERGWAGALSPVQSDYLMVVDANVGFNKASALVERRVTYRLNLAADGSAQAQATLTYHHPAQKQAEPCRPEMRPDPVYEQNMARCYWDYVRLVVPATAQLHSGPNMVVDSQQLLRNQPTTGEIDTVPLAPDKVSWGKLFVLAPQQTLSLDYAYALPAGTAHAMADHWLYSLYLQKQAGTLAPPVEVMINLPPGAQFLSSQPSPLEQRGELVTYQFELKTDQELKILYTVP